MGRKPILSEQAMQRLERSIPESAGAAFKRAFQHALSSGGKLVVAEGGNLVETSADGTHRIIKSLPEHIQVAPGSKRVLSRPKK